MSDKIEWGVVTGTHGVRGEMKVAPWVDFLSLYKKVKSLDIDGKGYNIISVRGHKEAVLLMLEGIDSMDRAQLMRGKVLTTPREDIDLGEGHYFYSDLEGFEVFDERLGRVIGRLKRVDEYPAGDMYIVEARGREVMIPLNDAFDRGVSLEDKRILVCTIEGMIDDED